MGKQVSIIKKAGNGRLIGCVIAYNEERLLPGCLESLRSHVDELVVVEGRIDEMPGVGAHSIDATAFIARRYGATVIQAGKPWPDEQTMRSQYLRGKDGDWYFVMDADEVLITPLPRPESLPDVPAFKVRLTMMGTGDDWHPQRLFQHRGKMEYRGTHDALYSDGVWVSDRRVTPILPTVRLIHRQPMRSKARLAKKKIKRQLCQEKEAAEVARLYGG